MQIVHSLQRHFKLHAINSFTVEGFGKLRGEIRQGNKFIFCQTWLARDTLAKSVVLNNFYNRQRKITSLQCVLNTQQSHPSNR